MAIFLRAVSSSTSSGEARRKVSLRLLCMRKAGLTPTLLGRDDALEDLVPKLSDQRLLLLHVGVKRERPKHLPNGLIESVDVLDDGRGGSESGRNAGRGEEGGELGGESCEEVVEGLLPFEIEGKSGQTGFKSGQRGEA